MVALRIPGNATTTAAGLIRVDAVPGGGAAPIALTVPRLGAASGVADLDGAGLLPLGRLPAIPDASLSANVPLLSAFNTYTLDQYVTYTRADTDAVHKGFDAQPHVSAVTGANNLYGVVGEPSASHPSGSLPRMIGGLFTAAMSGAGTVTDCYGAETRVHNTSTGTLANAIGLRIDTMDNTGGGAITRAYGIYLDPQTAAATNYLIFAPTVASGVTPRFAVDNTGTISAGIINPSTLTGSGTVPLAALAGITTTELAANAGITAAQIAAVPTHASSHETGGTDAYIGIGGQQSAGLQENIGRWAAGAASTLPAGQIWFMYLTAAQTQTVAHISVAVNAAATGSPSLIRFGLYTIATPSTGAGLRLVAQTADVHATVFTAPLTVYTVAFDASIASSYSLTRGARYAVGLLQVGGASTTLAAASAPILGLVGINPTLCSSTATGQTDLIDNPSILNSGTNRLYWVALS